MMLEEIAQRAYAQTVKGGGITVNLQGAEPTSGYAYGGYPELEMVVPTNALTPELVLKYMQDRQSALAMPAHYLGVWNDVQTGNTFLDVSVVSPPGPDAIKDAKERNNIAVWDIGGNVEIPTGLSRDQKITSAVDQQAVLDSNAGRDLQGLPGPVNVPGSGPLQFHSHGDIQRIADEYNRLNGLGQHPTDYTRVDPQRAAQIAQEYEAMQHNPHDPQVAQAYDALKNETRAQYDHAVRNGYNFEFYPKHDPYPNSPREAVLDLHHNKHMYVYPTQSGYGMSDDPQDHPLLGDSGVRWNGQPVTHNDLFRAVHDFYGHAKEGLGFRADGEDNAYRQHAAMFSPQARAALASETRGQNSWVNYGPHGEHNQTATSDTVYAPQKAGLMPEWTHEPDVHAGRTSAVQINELPLTYDNGEDWAWANQRKPFVYHNGVINIGDLGTHHGNIRQHLGIPYGEGHEGWVNTNPRDADDEGFMDWYNKPPEHREVEETLRQRWPNVANQFDNPQAQWFDKFTRWDDPSPVTVTDVSHRQVGPPMASLHSDDKPFLYWPEQDRIEVGRHGAYHADHWTIDDFADDPLQGRMDDSAWYLHGPLNPMQVDKVTKALGTRPLPHIRDNMNRWQQAFGHVEGDTQSDSHIYTRGSKRHNSTFWEAGNWHLDWSKTAAYWDETDNPYFKDESREHGEPFIELDGQRYWAPPEAVYHAEVAEHNGLTPEQINRSSFGRNGWGKLVSKPDAKGHGTNTRKRVEGEPALWSSFGPQTDEWTQAFARVAAYDVTFANAKPDAWGDKFASAKRVNYGVPVAPLIQLPNGEVRVGETDARHETIPGHDQATRFGVTGEEGEGYWYDEPHEGDPRDAWQDLRAFGSAPNNSWDNGDTWENEGGAVPPEKEPPVKPTILEDDTEEGEQKIADVVEGDEDDVVEEIGQQLYDEWQFSQDLADNWQVIDRHSSYDRSSPDYGMHHDTQPRPTTLVPLRTNSPHGLHRAPAPPYTQARVHEGDSKHALTHAGLDYATPLEELRSALTVNAGNPLTETPSVLGMRAPLFDHKRVPSASGQGWEVSYHNSEGSQTGVHSVKGSASVLSAQSGWEVFSTNRGPTLDHTATWDLRIENHPGWYKNINEPWDAGHRRDLKIPTITLRDGRTIIGEPGERFHSKLAERMGLTPDDLLGASFGETRSKGDKIYEVSNPAQTRDRIEEEYDDWQNVFGSHKDALRPLPEFAPDFLEHLGGQPEPWEHGFNGKGHVYQDGTIHAWKTDGFDGTPGHADIEDRPVRSWHVIEPSGSVRELFGPEYMSEEQHLPDAQALANAIGGQVDGRQGDYFWDAFAKVASVPQVFEHDTPGTMIQPDDPWGDMAYAGRRPMIYNPAHNALHIGNFGSTHNDVIAAVRKKGQNNPTGHYNYGWLGPNPERIKGDPVSEINGQEYGWAGYHPGPHVDEALKNHFQAAPALENWEQAFAKVAANWNDQTKQWEMTPEEKAQIKINVVHRQGEPTDGAFNETGEEDFRKRVPILYKHDTVWAGHPGDTHQDIASEFGLGDVDDLDTYHHGSWLPQGGFDKEPGSLNWLYNSGSLKEEWNEAILKALNAKEDNADWEQAFAKTAAKLEDFLMNPKSRPDLQTPEAQQWLQHLQAINTSKIDPLTPWLTREWKKKRIEFQPGGWAGAGNMLYQKVPATPNPHEYGTPEWQAFDQNYVNQPVVDTLHPATLGHWADWYHSNHPTRQGVDLMKMTTGDLHPRIQEWNDAMQAEAEKKRLLEGAQGEVVHQYPNGWTMQNLTSPEALKYEGDVMGHCVGGYHDKVDAGHTSIYSLRDHEGKPHVTMEIVPQKFVKPPFDLHDRLADHAVLRGTVAPDAPPELVKLRQSIEQAHALNAHKEPYSPYKGEYDPERHFDDPGKKFTYKTPEEQAQSLYWQLRYNHEAETGDPVINKGHIEQIQGQGNTIPKPEYQAMVKDFFNKLPEEEKPYWPGETVTDAYDLGEDMGGYHAHGDYGVQDHTKYDWPTMIDNAVDSSRYWGGPDKDASKKIIDTAESTGRLKELQRAAEASMIDNEHRWMQDNEHAYDERDIADWAGMEKENYMKDMTDEEGYDPEWDDPEEFDERQWKDDINEHRSDFLYDKWQESEQANWFYDLIGNIDHELRRQHAA